MPTVPGSLYDLIRQTFAASGERRNSKAGCENDREPDQPHGHVVGMAGHQHGAAR